MTFQEIVINRHHSGKWAYIKVRLEDTDEIMQFIVKNPRGLQPYFIADGARHDLTEEQIEELHRKMGGYEK